MQRKRTLQKRSYASFQRRQQRRCLQQRARAALTLSGAKRGGVDEAGLPSLPETGAEARAPSDLMFYVARDSGIMAAVQKRT